MSHKIVFLDRETLDANVRKPNFPHEYTEYAQTAPDQIVERLKGATICITNKVPLREATLKQLPDLKLIAVAATGTDVIDKAYTSGNGIVVSNIRNYAFNTLPEHVFALLFALRRNLVNYYNSVRQGRWGEANQFCYFDYPIYDIAGSTLGIIGYGALGREIEKRAVALGMKVLINDVTDVPNKVDIPTILREADVITLNLPLTPETKNMIGAKELASMKKTRLHHQYGARRHRRRSGARRRAAQGRHRRRRLRRADGRAAQERQHPARSDDSQSHHHAACRLGLERSDAGAGRPACRQHRRLCRRQPAQRRDGVRLTPPPGASRHPPPQAGEGTNARGCANARRWPSLLPLLREARGRVGEGVSERFEFQ